MRIAMGVEYDGSAYCGWQLQKGDAPTVQGVVEQAVGKVANHSLRIQCAGRTDTGVHATQQVIHFDTDAQRSERGWVFGSNTNLPHNVAILWAKPVSAEFHARFSAQRRSYRYIIYCRPVRPTFMSHRVTWSYTELDIERMQEAATHLLGENNFNAYRTVHCQAKSPVRHLFKLDVERKGPFIYLDLQANGFLHHMVRNIAGVLMAIGRGEKGTEWSREILLGEDRRLGGITAPAHGLYFTGVHYPSELLSPQGCNVPELHL